MSSSKYVAVTRGIRISVLPQYVADESDPDENRYFWAYTIDIENEGIETVRLRSRGVLGFGCESKYLMGTNAEAPCDEAP